MPIVSPGTYLSTIDRFLGHWRSVDDRLSPGALVLTGGYSRGSLQADRDALADVMAQIEAEINDCEGLRVEREAGKGRMRERMRQLKAFIEGQLADSVYPGQVAGLVRRDATLGKWSEAMEHYEHLWETIEASPPTGFVPPLTLAQGYSLADFTADANALRATFRGLVAALQDADRRRDDRERRIDEIRRQLVRYRLAVAGMFPLDDPLVTSLPKLNPRIRRRPKPIEPPDPEC